MLEGLLGIIVGIYAYGLVGSTIYRLNATKQPGTSYLDGALWRMLPSLVWSLAWPAKLYRFVLSRRT